jgi:ubiquinone/menaquinone biosynthesis C-methylase UbiE
MSLLPLSDKLNKIKQVIDIETLASENQTMEKVGKYYKWNKIPYLIHSRDGYNHMGISEGKNLEDDDFNAQAEFILKYVTKYKPKNILELASGLGSNTHYLHEHYSAQNFYTLDFAQKPLKKNKSQNIQYMQSDYHNLSEYQDKNIDLVFIIEALCYSQNKKKVLKEVYKILNPKGIFIIIDGYQKMPLSTMTEEQHLSLNLTCKAMAVESFTWVEDMKKDITDVGFKIIYEKNVSDKTLPTMYKFENWAHGFFTHKSLAKIINKLLPKEFVRNTIAGYLMPNLTEDEVACYYIHVLQKNN